MFENAPLSKAANAQMDDYSFNERKPVWRILVIGLLVIGLVAAGVYYGFINRPAFLTKQNTGIIATDTATIAESRQEVLPETKVEPAPVIDESAASTSTQNKYHIIAGAFIVEKNASAFMQQLQKSGYDPKIVLKRNEYSFVSIFSFETFKEANEKYHSISGMPVWIMKY